MRVRFGDVAIERRETCKGSKSDYPVVGLEHLVPENVKLSAWDVSGENTFTKLFRKGDVLFGRRRAYLKKAVVAPFDGICSGDITVIVARPEYILPELLPFVVQNDAFFDYAVGKSAGSLSPRVKWEYLSEYEFELPSMEEQRKLARVLWAVNDTVEAYRRLLIATEDLVRGRFLEMFGDPLRNEKYSCVEIGQLGKVITGTTPNTKNSEYYNSQDIMFIKPGDIAEENVTVISSSEAYISDNARKVSRIFPEKSVLVTCIGIIGKIGISTKESSCNQQINVIIPHSSVNYMYLAHALLYMRFRLQEAANAPLVPILNKRDFSRITLPLPPYELQQQFADFVRQAEKAKHNLKSALTAAKNISKSILANNLR